MGGDYMDETARGLHPDLFDRIKATIEEEELEHWIATPRTSQLGALHQVLLLADAQDVELTTLALVRRLREDGNAGSLGPSQQAHDRALSWARRLRLTRPGPPHYSLRRAGVAALELVNRLPVRWRA